MSLVVIAIPRLRGQIKRFKPSAVANHTGLSRQYVSGFVKRGTSSPSYESVMAMARFLLSQGVDIKKFQELTRDVGVKARG
jgi:transcriptional regulator with XRE-family HTH domain